MRDLSVSVRPMGNSVWGSVEKTKLEKTIRRYVILIELEYLIDMGVVVHELKNITMTTQHELRTFWSGPTVLGGRLLLPWSLEIFLPDSQYGIIHPWVQRHHLGIQYHHSHEENLTQVLRQHRE